MKIFIKIVLIALVLFVALATVENLPLITLFCAVAEFLLLKSLNK